MEGMGVNGGFFIAQIINFTLVCIPILIIGLVVYLVIKSTNRPPTDTGATTASQTRNALEILDQRLARGEIDEREYRRLKAILNESAKV